MGYNRIEVLLEKFLEGQSSLDEERELRLFFSEAKNIPEQFLYAKDLFAFFSEEEHTDYPALLVSDKRRVRNRLFQISGIAASLILGLILTITNVRNEPEVVYAYVNGIAITDISIAEKYTRQILHSASQSIDVGVSNLSLAKKYTNTSLRIKN